MDESTGILPDLPAVAGKPVHVAFDGGRLTSDAGILLLAAIEQRLKIAERLAACLEDRRDPERVVHGLAEMIRYRALLIAAAYPDGNDCDALNPTRPSRWRWGGCRKAVRICARSRPSAGWRTCPARPRATDARTLVPRLKFCID
jgi:Transposase DDE domain group 1